MTKGRARKKKQIERARSQAQAEVENRAQINQINITGEQATAQPKIAITAQDANPDDDQAGPVKLDDDKAGASGCNPLTKEIAMSWKTTFAIDGNPFITNLKHVDDDAVALVTVRTPPFQRAFLAIRISVKRDRNADDNPGHISHHVINVEIPASGIVSFDDVPSFEATAYPDGTTPEDLPEYCGQGFTDSKKSPFQYMAPWLKRSSVAGNNNQGQAELILRRDDEVTALDMDAFVKAIHAEMTYDPFSDWIANSPNKETLQIGNILPFLDRPQIPLQQALIVAHDKKAYMIPHIYCAAYEDDYEQALIDEFKGKNFFIRVCQLPTALQCLVPEGQNNGQDIDETLTTDSTEDYLEDMRGTAYMATIDFADFAVSFPQPGDVLYVTLNGLQDGVAPFHEGQDTTPSGQAGDPAPEPKPHVDGDNDKDKDKPSPDDDNAEDGNFIYDEFAHEEDKNMLDLEATVNEKPPNIGRRRVPKWTSAEHDRPYVPIKLPCLNWKAADTPGNLKTKMDSTTAISVSLESDHSHQNYKDDVRTMATLFASEEEEKIRFRTHLLFQNVDRSPLQRCNVDLLHGSSTIATTARSVYNESQANMVHSFKDAPEVIAVWGPFGTGKSTIGITESVVALSNPDKFNQVAYSVDTNFGVDDVALRMDRKCKELGLNKKIIRLHSLKSEKAGVYRRFANDDNAPENRFQAVTDTMLAEIAAAQFLTDITGNYIARRKAGDPRRVLEHMSLAQAMFDRMNSQADLGITTALRLRSMLRFYGKDGSRGTDGKTRTHIKEELNILMAETLQNADALIGTHIVFARFNVFTNIKPTLFIVDEASRCSEIRSCIPKAFYNPQVVMFLGDPRQLRPVVKSAGKHHDFDKDSYYLNPYQYTGLLPYIEHLIMADGDTFMLTHQHRCLGDIPHWPSKQFYYGRVTTSPLTPDEKTKVTAARDFVQEVLGCEKRTNRLAVNLHGSRWYKEQGGFSSVNPDQLAQMKKDLQLIMDDKRFDGMSIMILSFYKAQCQPLRELVKPLVAPDRAAGRKDRIEVRTVDGAEGYQADIVLIHTVRAKGAQFIGDPNRMCVAFTRARFLQLVYLDYGVLDGIARPHLNSESKHLYSF
ncbi:hypothetical protein BP5796_05371 [Coleophoma crateriformis]|uniref:DNA2/NAM7 helicase-like C-terminal domain-containing protein n=1 Tax=Coleophoma crateriformis TaxID=565419 RepID=A0A3D8S2Z5_9HELO|nr:hypothetical protein BP5796_05371 [Coleophoma crateriformis]